MLPSEMRSEVDNRCYSLIGTNSPLFIQPSLCQMESNLIWENKKPLIPMETNHNPISVNNLTPQMDVQMDPIVATNTSVISASDLATTKSIVTAKAERAWGLQPKYLWYNIWSPNSKTHSTADWTKIAQPLPAIPLCELNNPIYSQTIIDNPSLFKIVTPINVNRFEFLLQQPKSILCPICL